MLTQREEDIANVEADMDIQKLVQEWLRDYMGSRDGGQTVQNGESGEQVYKAEGAGIGGPEGAGIEESGRESY